MAIDSFQGQNESCGPLMVSWTLCPDHFSSQSEVSVVSLSQSEVSVGYYSQEIYMYIYFSKNLKYIRVSVS